MFSDPDDIFKVSPVQCEVNSDCAVAFEVTFNPNMPDRFYNTIFSGLIFWSSVGEKYYTIPIPVQIRAMGHTFEPGYGSLIPQVVLEPSLIKFPPCLPSSHGYSTCILRKQGDLPVQYKFNPPEKT